MERGEGERLHEARRKRFWGILGWLILLGFIAGAFTGFVMGHADHGETPLPDWAAALAVFGVVLFALGGAYGSWRFFQSVDEVEVADNLWASLIGLYVYAILFPGWWILNKLGQVPEPDDWAIFGASMCTAVIIYLYRKWISR